MASSSTEQRKAALRWSRRASSMPVVSAPKPDGSKPRYHAFDALRGMTMFLVIGLHSALAYIQLDIPGAVWCIRDAPTLPVFEWFCWWSMGVSNPLYFTIAGFFAVDLYNSRGLRRFLENRSRRILVPLLVGGASVLPAGFYAWAYGWLVSGRCTLREILRFKFRDPAIQSERFGMGHLWFLQYLFLMLLAFALVRWLSDRRGPGRFRLPWRDLVDFVLRSPWRPLLLAVPTTAVLWVSRHRMGIDAVMARHNSCVPELVRWLHYASFFLVGAGLYRMRHDLDRLARPGPWYLILSIPVFAVRAWLLARDWTVPLQGPATLALAASGALCAWLVVFGFLGLFLRLFKKSYRAIRYLADSSYWIYLIHLPIVALIQVDLYRVPGHALWKFPLVLIGTLAIGFGTYQTLVRHTAIGFWLHGPRERPLVSSSK